MTTRKVGEEEQPFEGNLDPYTHTDIYSNDDVRIGINACHSKLQESRVNTDKYYFVNDDRPTKEIRVSSTTRSHENRKTDATPELYTNNNDNNNETKRKIIEVKTLVWEAIIIQKLSISDNEKIYGSNSKEYTTQVSKYFTTALKVEDKVNLGALRSIVKSEWNITTGTLLIQLARRDRAESLTGFQSGTMPPTWHNVSTHLFVDTAIIQELESLNSISLEGAIIDDDGDDGFIDTNRYIHLSKDFNVYASVGCGVQGYSLHVSLHSLLQSASQSSTETTTVLDIRRFSVDQVEQYSKPTHKKVRLRGMKGISSTDPKSGVVLEEMNSNNNDMTPDEMVENVSRRLFMTACRKKSNAELVKRLICKIGDELPSYMETDGANPEGDELFNSQSNKNALHLAAWKGDLETVMILINACKQYKELQDVINTISCGEGNYGKTPIFYSITQCRDDAVLLLLSLGANLLIVNNKGQTPVSMAISHLKPETCDFMFTTEEEQIRNGGKFINYRASHSDGKRYGDLDPRFLDEDDINMDDGVRAEIDHYRKSFGSVSSSILPRNVRETTRMWKKESGKIETQRREDIQPPPRKSPQRPLIQNDTEADKENKVKGTSIKKRSLQTINSQRENIDPKDIENMDNLLIEDIQVSCELVDDAAGIESVDHEINGSLLIHTEKEKTLLDSDDDTYHIASSWGIDCEWRPARISGQKENPVATLQLSSANRAFVLDLQTICQSGIDDEEKEMTALESQMNSALTKLFADERLAIIGFGTGQDIEKLVTSFPHIPCFRNFHTIVDLTRVSRAVYVGSPKTFLCSLQKAVAFLIGNRLDKSEQCSEWDVRPLRKEQINYAALDAAVLPYLLNKLHEIALKEGYTGPFLRRKNPNLCDCYRFTILESLDDGYALRVISGGVRTSMGIKIARQIWPIHKAAPSTPEKFRLSREITMFTSRKNNQTKEQDKKLPTISKVKRKALMLSDLNADFSKLPPAGITIGYTKDSCIERLVGKDFFKSLPDDTYLKYNRRGGVLELKNAFLLFINFQFNQSYSKYRNEFLGQGEMITFSVEPKSNKCQDGHLLKNLYLAKDDESRKEVFVFIRGSSRHKFLFCGQGFYVSHAINGDLVDLILELESFEEMKHYDDESSYMSILSEHHTAVRGIGIENQNE